MSLSGHREGVAFSNGQKQQNWHVFSMSGWIRLHILCMAKKSAKFDGGVISQFLKTIVPNMHCSKGKTQNFVKIHLILKYIFFSYSFKTHFATTKYF